MMIPLRTTPRSDGWLPGAAAWSGTPFSAIIVAVLLAANGFVSAAAAQDDDDPWAYCSVYRDEWGTPHIAAENPFTLGFAFGYAQAEDHLEEMLRAYCIANGRAAAIWGQDYAESDAFSLRMGHARLAEEAFSQADEFTATICTGFAQGINAWILEHPAVVPEWADGAKPADVLALWHAFLTSQAPFDLPGVYRRAPAMETGNGWALAPKRTAEGQTLLVLNAHENYDGPFRWCEAHLIMGDYNVYGATLFGLPLLLMGHNDTAGWAIAPNFPDSGDIFMEQISPDAGGNPKSMFNRNATSEEDLALQMMSKMQPYYVRTDAGLEQRLVSVLATERGPIFQGQDGELYSWRVGGYRDFGGLCQLHDMGIAKTVEAFQLALLEQQLSCFHILYADRSGNIFYQYNAKIGRKEIPKVEVATEGEVSEEERAMMAQAGDPYVQMRAQLAKVDWTQPQEAYLDGWGWREAMPEQELPWLLNPPCGYLQICGSPPWLAAAETGFSADATPKWLCLDEDTYRAQRVRRLLQTGQRSAADMRALLYDDTATAAADIVPVLLKAAEEQRKNLVSAHPDLPAAIALLQDWNRRASTDAAGMAFYNVWWNMVRERTAATLPTDTARYAFLKQDLPESRQLALDAAADAVRTLRNELDRIDPAWSEVHRLVRGARDEAVSGAISGEPVLVSGDSLFERGRWRASYGYGFAMIVQFGPAPSAVSIVPFGASERAASPHYADQLDLFREKRFKHTRYREEDVLRHVESAHGRRLTFYPAGVPGTIVIAAPQAVTASVAVSPAPPEPLTPGITAFSLYTKPVVTPGDIVFQTTVTLAAVPETCKNGDTSVLRLYGYAPGVGWNELAGQQFDATSNTFTAAQSGGGVFALLGPEEALVVPSKEPAPVPGKPKESATKKPSEMTPAPEAPKPEAAPGEATPAAPLPEDPMTFVPDANAGKDAPQAADGKKP